MLKIQGNWLNRYLIAILSKRNPIKGCLLFLRKYILYMANICHFDGLWVQSLL